MAEVLIKSQAIPLCFKNKEQVAMALLSGKESGLSCMESLNAYYLVNGKFVIYGQATLTQLKRSGFSVRWGECSEKKATVTVIAPDKSENTETYTIEEAIKTGQTTKDVWKLYTKSMLRWKALAANIRFFCPEVLNGYYLKEDIVGGTIDPIDAEITEPDVEPSNQPTEAVDA